MHWTSSDVMELLDESPRDAVGARTIFVPLDEGDTTWDPSRGTEESSYPGHLGRAKGGGQIIGVVYVQFADGGIGFRQVQSPAKPTKASRKEQN